MRLRKAEKQAKVPVQAPRPVSEEKDDEVVRQQLAETDAGKANPWLLEETRESIRIC